MIVVGLLFYALDIIVRRVNGLGDPLVTFALDMARDIHAEQDE